MPDPKDEPKKDDAIRSVDDLKEVLKKVGMGDTPIFEVPDLDDETVKEMLKKQKKDKPDL